MRLQVDGTYLDISQDEVVAVTLTADSIEDANNIQSSYTNEFALLPTRTNRNVLGNILGLDATNTEYLATSAQLLNSEGVIILNNGLLLVREYNDVALQLSIVEGAVNFFDELEGYTLQMIAPNSIGTPVARTEANIVANIDNDYTSGFSYALVDYGDEPTTTFTVDYMWPCSFVHELFERIADETSFTFDTTTGLFQDSEFRKLALPYDGDRYNKESYFLSDIAGFSITSGTAGPGTYVTIFASKVPIPNRGFDGFGFEVFEDRKSLIFEAYWSVDITTNAGAYEYNIRIRNITQGITYASFSSGAITGAGASVTDSRTIRSSLTRNYNSGDVIRLEIDAVTGTLFDFTEGYYRNDDRRSGAGAGGTSPSIPNPYAVPTTALVLDPLCLLPDMDCLEFIKAVCNMFCARLDVDVVSKTITIRKFEDYSTDTANSIDWSGKVDSLATFEIEYSFGSYTKQNLFLFDNDNDIAETYGQGEIEIANANLPDDSYNVIELPFSASLNSGVNIVSIPILSGSPLDLSEELAPRIIRIESTTGSITVGSTNVTDYNITSQPFWAQRSGTAGGSVSSTGFLGVYWLQYSKLLQAMQKVTLSVKLSALDFSNIDFFKPVYIRYSDGWLQLNGYYLLQEVKEYRGSGSVQVELININIS